MPNKLSSYEPGQIMHGMDLSTYRVVSKVVGPEGAVVKLANLLGEPVSLPVDFTPVSPAFARFASSLRFHLAYNKDFDLYIRAYCEQAGLPIPVGPDGKPFRWAEWLQGAVFPKLYTPVKDPETSADIRDEAIHEMLFTVLERRRILDKFKKAIKRFTTVKEKGKNIQFKSLPVAKQLTVYLSKNFKWRIEEMNRKIEERMPPEEISMVQEEGQGFGGRREQQTGEEVNILETKEHAHTPAEFGTIESEHDIAKFRNGFYGWLKRHQSELAAQRFITLFDIYTRLISDASETKRHELEEPWAEETGLSKPALFEYMGRLAVLLEQYIREERHNLGEGNIFVKLIDSIHHQREKIKKKKQPAMAASLLASLVIAAPQMEECDQKTADHKPPSKEIPSLESLGPEWRINQKTHELERNKAILRDPRATPEEKAIAQSRIDEIHVFGSAQKTAGWFDVRMQEGGEDFKCPHCGKGLVVENWNTEYGDALSGEHDIKCPNCSKPFVVDIETRVDYRSRVGHVASAGITVKIAKIVRGDELTPEMRQQVLDAFPYRWTSDSPHTGKRKPCPNCDIRNPFVGGSAEGHNHPTIPLQTDAQWVAEHSFNFTNDGRLIMRGGAMPAYMGGPGANPVLMSQAVLDDREEQDQALVDRVKSSAFESVTFPEEHVKENLSEEELDKLGLHEIDPYTERNKERKDVRLHGTRVGKTAEFDENTLPSEHDKRRKSYYGRQLSDAVANLLEARSDQMLTGEDWRILEEATSESDKSPLRQAAVATLHRHWNDMISPEEWDDLAKTYEAASGHFIEWRTEDEIDAEPGYQEHLFAGIGHEFYDGIRPQVTEGDTGRLPHAYKEGNDECENCSKSNVTISVREDGNEVGSEEYTGDLAGLLSYVEHISAANPEFAVVMTIDEEGMVTEDTFVGGKHVGETVEKSAAVSPQDMAIGNIEQSQIGPKQKPEAPRVGGPAGKPPMPVTPQSPLMEEQMAAVAAGPATPAQLQTQNMQQSQGIKPSGEQLPPPAQPQRPGTSVAITPESGRGPDEPMRKTVPPEIPNQNFHMSAIHTADDEAILVDRRKFFENVRKSSKTAGHFYNTVTGVGRNKREAQDEAVSDFLSEHGHRHNVRDVSKARFIEKVPPTKRKETPQRGMTYVTFEPDPSAPENEWLEKWEFELHTHA